MSGATHCKGCGRQIVYVRMPSGADMPVDLGLQVIAVDMDAENNFVGSVANPNPNIGVAYGLNHFMNCPKANDYSKRGKAGRTPAGEPVDQKSEAAGDPQP